MNSDVVMKMDKIRQIFQHAQMVAASQDDLDLLAIELDKTENEFRSVAYESAAMSIALKDFDANNNLDRWHLFLKGIGAKHAAQIHAGLGWALAQRKIPVAPVIEKLSPLMQFRTLDGYGYYEGIFRQRQTVGNQVIPQEINAHFLRGYDQGIGRSLWYYNKGAIEKIIDLIKAFAASRHADLWRGVGVACIYAGGCDETALRFILSKGNSEELSLSAALVSRARSHALALTPDAELACRIWCARSANEIVEIAINAEPSSEMPDAYFTWLSNMRAQLNELTPQ